MRQIFIDNELERSISGQGYLVIKSFAPVSVCDQLMSCFDEGRPVGGPSFTITNWNKDEGYRKHAHEEIVSGLADYSRRYLKDYKPVMGVFTSKRPGENSEMLIHQDWSLVDESRFRSVSIWMALDDMDQRNGNLQVAAGSHVYAGFPRGMNIPAPFEAIRSHMYSELTDIPLKKGDAVVFDHRLIHASPVNNSDKIRVAAVLALIPEEAELIHYYKDLDNDQQLEILKLDERDFFLLDFFDMPNKPRHLSSLGKAPFFFRQLSIADL